MISPDDYIFNCVWSNAQLESDLCFGAIMILNNVNHFNSSYFAVSYSQLFIPLTNLVRHEKFPVGIDGAYLDAIKQFVLAGLPTTSTRTDLRAYWSSAMPCDLKILTLAANKSLRSIPSRLGIEPARMATSMSRNASASWSVHTMSLNNGSEQSGCKNQLLRIFFIQNFHSKSRKYTF